VADSTSDYIKAYEAAKEELSQLIAAQEKLERRKIALRRRIETLAASCADRNIQIEPSVEAVYLLASPPLSQDIRAILRSQYPAWQSPHQIRTELERLGHELGKYRNVQSTIHTVMKRMVESGDAEEDNSPEDGKQIYRALPLTERIREAGNLQGFAKSRQGFKSRKK